MLGWACWLGVPRSLQERHASTNCLLAAFCVWRSQLVTASASCRPTVRAVPQVYYNGQRVKVKTFQEYVDMYLGPKETGARRVCERFSDRWEVCIAPSEGQFNQVGGWQAGQGWGSCFTPRCLLGPVQVVCEAGRGVAFSFRRGTEPQGHSLLSAVASRWQGGERTPCKLPHHPPLQVSFVNSICTSKGGTHVNYIADQASLISK